MAEPYITVQDVIDQKRAEDAKQSAEPVPAYPHVFTPEPERPIRTVARHISRVGHVVGMVGLAVWVAGQALAVASGRYSGMMSFF